MPRKQSPSKNAPDASHEVHDIHDYCSKTDDETRQEEPRLPEQSNNEVMLDEVIVPNIEAEEVLLETVIDEAHVPILKKIKQEINECEEDEEIIEEEETIYEDEEVFEDVQNDGQSSSPSSNRKSSFWTNENTKLLLDMRWECRDLFMVPTCNSKPWRQILKKMKAVKPDFPCSEHEIGMKFRNLCGTYRQNALHSNDNVTWPWFKEMHRILSYKDKKRPAKGYYPAMHRLVLEGKLNEATFSPSMHFNRALYNGWTEDNVILLINVCQQFSKELQMNPRKVKLWKAIKSRMTHLDPEFRKTYMKVYSQWKALVKEYKATSRAMRKRYLDGSQIKIETPPWHMALDNLLSSWNVDHWDVETEELVDEGDDDDYLGEETISSVARNRHGSFKPVKSALRSASRDEKVPQDKNPGLWTKRNIELLISSRAACEEQFQEPEGSYQDSWTLVRDTMHAQNPEFVGTYQACADKWKALIKVYHMVREKKKTSKKDLHWEWWDTMDKALWPNRPADDEPKEHTDIVMEEMESETSRDASTTEHVANPVIVIQETDDGSYIATTENGDQPVYTIVAETPSTSADMSTIVADTPATSGNSVTPMSNARMWNEHNISLLIKARGATSYESHGRKKMFWKNVRKRILMEDSTFPATAEQCWVKWRNLVQTYNVNKRRAEELGPKTVGWEWFTPIDRIMTGQNVVDDPYTDHENGGLSQVESDEELGEKGQKLWVSKNIRLLLNVREECNELFASGSKVSGVWQIIRDRMVALDPSFTGTPNDCNEKFRNLLGTYRTNRKRRDKMGRDHVYWPWFDDMDRIMRYFRPKLSLAKLADLSDIEDDDELAQGTGEADNMGLSDFEGLDSNSSGKLWNSHNTKLLILAREQFHDSFSHGSKNNSWVRVHDRLLQLNPDFPGSVEDCSRKWRNLTTTYRQVKRRKQLGSESETWQWFFLMDRYFTQKHGYNDDPIILAVDEVLKEEPPVQETKSKKYGGNNAQSHQVWLRDYLQRREERDKRAEQREERMLSLMEQLLSLERKRLFAMNKLVTQTNDTDREFVENANVIDISTFESVDSSLRNLESPIFGPKTHKIHLMDVRATLMDDIRKYTDREFKNYFRVSREIFKLLKQNIIYVADHPTSGGRPRLGKDLAILMSLWLLGNGNETFRTTAVKFGTSESTCYRTHKILVRKIAELHTKYIKWPAGVNMDAVRNGFNALRGEKSFPGVVGCVDGTHISIKKQTSDSSYMNNNKHHSVILQAVCDYRGLFLDVCAGWPGSLHDSTVWKASPMYHALEKEPDTVPCECHLVGDCAYPLSTYLMKPYSDDGNLTVKHQQYNECLLSTWEVIEGAFALLKARCGCLKKMIDSLDLEFIKDIIMACCVIHNICLLEDDDSKYDITMDTTVELDSGLYHYDYDEDPVDLAADLKRSALAELVWRKHKLQEE